MTEVEKQYDVTMTRVDSRHYRASNASGASIEFGQGEGLMSPVEVLLAAIMGCSAIDVDVVTSRRSEPERFTVRAQGDRINESGASRLGEIRVHFDVSFPDTPEGRQAQAMIPRLIQLSKEVDCTVSRTVEHATPVKFTHS